MKIKVGSVSNKMIRYAYGSFLSNYQKVIAKRVD